MGRSARVLLLVLAASIFTIGCGESDEPSIPDERLTAGPLAPPPGPESFDGQSLAEVAQHTYDQLFTGNPAPFAQRASSCGATIEVMVPAVEAVAAELEATDLEYGRDIRLVVTSTGSVQDSDSRMYAVIKLIVSDAAEDAGLSDGAIIDGTQWIFVDGTWRWFCDWDAS